MSSCFPRVHRGTLIKDVLDNRAENENMFYLETVDSLDMDVFNRMVCAFMNSQSGGSIWLGLDERGRCQGIGMDRPFRDKIRREFAQVTFDCGYYVYVQYLRIALFSDFTPCLFFCLKHYLHMRACERSVLV